MATLTNTKIKDTYDGLLKTTDNEALDITGTTLIEDGLGNASALSVGRSGNGVTTTGDLNVDSGTLFVDSSANEVGINTTNPQTDLHIVNSGNVTLRLETSGTSDNSGIQFGDSDNPTVGRVIYDHSTDAMSLYTSNTEKVIIDSSGNVGIGTSTPAANLEVSGNATRMMINTSNSAQTVGLLFGLSQSSVASVFSDVSEQNLIFNTGGSSERMRIDSSGVVQVKNDAPTIQLYSTDGSLVADQLIGTLDFYKSDTSGEGAGVSSSIQVRSENNIGSISYMSFHTDGGSGDQNAERMRIESGGDIKLADVSLRSVTLSDVALAVGSNATGGQIRFTPITDDAVNLGSVSNRWDNVYAANGTIQTSDINEKQQIESLDDVELRVATRIKGLVRKFKWNSAVDKKGDDSRIHIGVIAQDVKEAFELEGLDPDKYALFCSDNWWEKEVVEVDSEGVETTKTEVLEEYEEGATERTRLGVRYTELLAFVISAL